MATYGYGLNDPTPRNAAASLAASGWNVTFFQGPLRGTVASEAPAGVAVKEWWEPRWSRSLGPLDRVAKWRAFRHQLRAWIRDNRPQLVVTIMHRPFAALDLRARTHSYRVASCIYDVPSLPDAGRLDRVLIRRTWRRIGEADVVWVSDRCRGEWVTRFGGLERPPLICHNCPPAGWLPEPSWPRNGWLRAELRRQGATLGEQAGCILLRAGAIGETCGIEPTLEALGSLPRDHVFLMMGRPSPEYGQHLQRMIDAQRLRGRAFFWNRPPDELWMRALQGADIGHLVHGPFPAGRAQRLHELNSSLSNYRLFQYMAAGLPILSYQDPRMAQLYQDVPCFRVARLTHLVEDIAASVRELGGAPATRRELGRAARQAFDADFNWEHQFAPVLQMLNEGRASGVAMSALRS